MNLLTISTFCLALVVGALFNVLHRHNSALDHVSQSQPNPTANFEIQDMMTLDDLPPPDDTYTPDQRRYS